MSRGEGKIYVGNLPPDVKEADIEDIFYKFGKITNVNLKCPTGQPPFAFVEFDDNRDADDAIQDRDGYNYDGYKLRVERPRGIRAGGGGVGYGRGGYGRGGGGGFGRDNYVRDRGSRGGGARGVASNSQGSRRSDYRVLISGLPKSGSWQDLKDHMREAGDVCYADVYKDGTGVVEFLRYEDMKYAARKLDDTKFRSHEGETSHIRIKEDYGKGSKSGSRSRSRSHSPKNTRGSPDYSPVRR